MEERIERAGFGFRVNHAFDPGIQQVEIVEIQIARIRTDPRSGEAAVEAQSVIRDFRGNALTRLGDFGDRCRSTPANTASGTSSSVSTSEMAAAARRA